MCQLKFKNAYLLNLWYYLQLSNFFNEWNDFLDSSLNKLKPKGDAAMKGFPKMYVVLTVLALALVLPSAIWAGGLYLSEVSNAEVGLASAGSAARAQDASTVFTNPAGMTRLDRPEIELGIQPIYLGLRFDPDSDTHDSNRYLPNGKKAEDGDATDWIPAGSTFYVHPLTKDLSVGIGVLGYFGLAIDYGDDWVGRYSVQEVTLQGMTIMPSVAYRVNNWLSVGAGLNAMYGIFKQDVAVNNNPLGIGSYPDGQLRLDDEDWGFGGLFGVLVEPLKTTRFGLTYMTETEFEFSTTTEFRGLRPGLETALNNHGLLNTEIDMTITAPQAVMLSAYHELTDDVAIMGNVGWQDWSEYGMMDISVTAEETTSLTADLDLKDTWHGAVGAQFKISEPWLMTFGLSYDSSMVDDDDRIPLMPVGESWKFGVGSKHKLNKNIDLGVAYEFAYAGDLPMDLEETELKKRVSGQYSGVHMHFINVAMNWKF